MLVTALLGFGAVFFLQRKGWPYHSYPMAVFALLALGSAIRTGPHLGSHGRHILRCAAVVLVALFISSAVWFDRAFDARPLQAAVARLGPHPTILAISAQAGIGHPLTRAVGGVWASRQQGLLVAGYYRFLQQAGSPDQQTLARLDGYAAREREWLIADFRSYRPTVVLVDHLSDDWGGWLSASLDLVALMRSYRRVETRMDIDIYRRIDRPAAHRIFRIASQRPAPPRHIF